MPRRRETDPRRLQSSPLCGSRRWQCRAGVTGTSTLRLRQFSPAMISRAIMAITAARRAQSAPPSPPARAAPASPLPPAGPAAKGRTAPPAAIPRAGIRPGPVRHCGKQETRHNRGAVAERSSRECASLLAASRPLYSRLPRQISSQAGIASHEQKRRPPERMAGSRRKREQVRYSSVRAVHDGLLASGQRQAGGTGQVPPRRFSARDAIFRRTLWISSGRQGGGRLPQNRFPVFSRTVCFLCGHYAITAG